MLVFVADCYCGDCRITHAIPGDSIRLTLVCLSSIRSGSNLVTEPSVQLDLESGTICQHA